MVDKLEAGERWQHVKRGTSYEVLGLGELQMQADVVDGSSLVIYRGEDDRLWAREEGEFLDGRFVKVATPANGEQVERARVELLNELYSTPTEDARSRVKVLEEALERAKHKLGHVSVDCMNGDNLAVTLCTHFDDGEGDEDEHGWTEAATAGCDATLKAIHAMYADVLRTALGNKETDRHG